MDGSSSGCICLVCMDAIKVFAVGACNHRNICARCNVKQRVFFKDTNCMMCKASLASIIYTTDGSREYSAFPAKKLQLEPLSGGQCAEESTRVFVAGLFAAYCPDCGPDAAFSDVKQLSVHVQKKHNKVFCPVCLSDRPVFIHDQVLFTKQELAQHLEKGDDKTHMKGHPKCKFCDQHFYGDDQLYEHMRGKHMECPVCKNRGVTYQYFSNYAELRRHWQNSRDHVFCTNEETCPMACFGNDVDLRQHMLSQHASSLTKQELKRLQNLTEVFDIRLRDERRGPGRNNSNNNNNSNSNSNNSSANSNASGGDGRVGFVGEAETDERVPRRQTSITHKQGESDLYDVVSRLPGPPASDMEARQRNGEVIARMKEILDEDVFAHFREAAKRFRDGEIKPQEYFDAFLGIFGEEEASSLFPKVASLLPMAEKRAALFGIYTRYFAGRKRLTKAPAKPPKGEKAGRKPEANSNNAGDAPVPKKACTICKQQKGSDEFTKNQWKKAPEPKCKKCLGADDETKTEDAKPKEAAAGGTEQSAATKKEGGKANANKKEGEEKKGGEKKAEKKGEKKGEKKADGKGEGKKNDAAKNRPPSPVRSAAAPAPAPASAPLRTSPSRPPPGERGAANDDDFLLPPPGFETMTRSAAGGSGSAPRGKVAPPPGFSNNDFPSLPDAGPSEIVTRAAEIAAGSGNSNSNAASGGGKKTKKANKKQVLIKFG